MIRLCVCVYVIKPTKLGVIALVEKQLSLDLLHNNIPREDRARGGHDRGHDGVCGEDVGVGVLHEL